jgi:hypothetical protein
MRQLLDHGLLRAPGPVGILAAQCAKFRGAARVILIDEHAYRLVRLRARPACQSCPLPCSAGHLLGLALLLRYHVLALPSFSIVIGLPLSFRTQWQPAFQALGHGTSQAQRRCSCCAVPRPAPHVLPVCKGLVEGPAAGVSGGAQAHVRKVVPGVETINFREVRP